MFEMPSKEGIFFYFNYQTKKGKHPISKMKSDTKENQKNEVTEPTEEEVIIIEFLEKLFEGYKSVSTIEECDLSITPDSILEQLEDFYPNTGFTKGHIVKLLLENNFKYIVVPGINTVWLIAQNK